MNDRFCQKIPKISVGWTPNRFGTVMNDVAESERTLPMPQAKQASKQKRRSKALPVLGAAGLSLSLAGSASAVPGGPAVNLPTSDNGDGNQVFLGEEEISDVSLATFYVFDKEGGDGTSSMVQLVGRGCGGCHGCGGCGHGGGCHAGGGCGGCHHGCGCHGCEVAATAAVAAVASALG